MQNRKPARVALSIHVLRDAAHEPAHGRVRVALVPLGHELSAAAGQLHVDDHVGLDEQLLGLEHPVADVHEAVLGHVVVDEHGGAAPGGISLEGEVQVVTGAQ